MGKTAYQKIVEAHLLKTLDDGSNVLRLDKVFCHEITTPPYITEAQKAGLDVIFNPNKVKAMIDHVNPAKDTKSAIQGQIMRDWAIPHQIEFFDVGRNGVCHAFIPEQGLILPGEIAIMGDSHTCTHGALNAFTAGVGTTELGHGIRTGLWTCAPQKVIKVEFNGALPENVFAKDLILTLIKKLGVSGAKNCVIEFDGSVVRGMRMDGRFTLCNMVVECGGTTGMVPIDDETISYLWPILKTNYKSPAEARDDLQIQWNSDINCDYDQTIEIDVSDLRPVTTTGYLVANVVDVESLAGTKINQVYIGSCTNGRMDDLRIAAHVFEATGKKVADGVRCIVVPATHHIWQQANEEGLLDVFMAANCVVSYPTCGACLGMSNGVLAPGEVCVSTTNRNFNGRMGKGGIVHLASPLTAAISATAGAITSPDESLMSGCWWDMNADTVIPSGWKDVPYEIPDYKTLAQKQSAVSQKTFSGTAYCFPRDAINTDEIIPAKYLNESDRKAMGFHCMEDSGLSPEEQKILRSQQILIAGKNFGTGSSREHAAWAFEATGINCIIAISFERIFYNNMFNCGMLCITLPEEDIKKIKHLSRIEVDAEAGMLKLKDSGDVLNFSLTNQEKYLIRNGGKTSMMLKMAAELYQQ